MNFLRIFLHTVLLGLFLLSVTGCAGQIGSQKALKDDWNFTNATNFNKGREAYKNGDYATALKKRTPLAEKGFARAQMNLGVLYFKGQGVQKDDAKAIRWFRVAAEQGYSQAQNGMGVIYMKGEVVSQDYITAIKWFKLAAEQGNAVAQKNMGVMYMKGEAADQDIAIKWFKLAAEQGNAGAQNNMGVMYMNGKGVTQDYARADMWFNIAASQGHEKAKRGRDKIEEIMTSADISKAQELARECIAKNYKDC